jgi:Tfp pilus assembly protein PilF
MPTNVQQFTTKACLVVSLFIGLGCSSQPKPAPAEPTLTAGIARLQANDNEGAAKILEQVTIHEPNNGRAWRNLALVYQNLKDWDRAISANQHALDIESSVPTPLFNLGVLYAQKGDRDQAFAWLTKAKATRKME